MSSTVPSLEVYDNDVAKAYVLLKPVLEVYSVLTFLQTHQGLYSLQS
jgi:hypothetical protein